MHRREPIYLSDLINTPLETLVARHRSTEKSRRVQRIVEAIRRASEEDIKIIERILNIGGNI